jgi:hypothetical protein
MVHIVRDDTITIAGACPFPESTPAMSTNYNRDDLFAHDPPGLDIINQVDSQPDSWLSRTRAGWKLAWRIGLFAKTKGTSPSQSVYLTWLRPDGTDINATKKFGMPVTDIIIPTAPVKAFYVGTDDMFRFTEEPDKAVQKIETLVGDDLIDTSRCPHIKEFETAMDKVVVDDLAQFLVENVAEHTLLGPTERELIEEDGPEAAIKALKRIIRNPMNKSYHKFGWNYPKHHILKQRYPSKNAPPLAKIAPKDVDILKLPEYARILNFIEKSSSFWTLNLLPIYLPDGTAVDPTEYHRLHSNGALVSTTLTVFGMFHRADGQHSIMGTNTKSQLLTNGTTEQSSGMTMNIMAMRGKRKCDDEVPASEQPAVQKRVPGDALTCSNAEMHPNGDDNNYSDDGDDDHHNG